MNRARFRRQKDVAVAPSVRLADILNVDVDTATIYVDLDVARQAAVRRDPVRYRRVDRVCGADARYRTYRQKRAGYVVGCSVVVSDRPAGS